MRLPYRNRCRLFSTSLPPLARSPRRAGQSPPFSLAWQRRVDLRCLVSRSPPLLLLLWLRPKQNRLPLVSSRLHHWLRLSHRCPSFRNRVLSLYHVSDFSYPMVTKNSKNHKLLCNRVEQAPYTVANSQMHYFACSTACSCLESQRVVCAFNSRKAAFHHTRFYNTSRVLGLGLTSKQNPIYGIH